MLFVIIQDKLHLMYWNLYLKNVFQEVITMEDKEFKA